MAMTKAVVTIQPMMELIMVVVCQWACGVWA